MSRSNKISEGENPKWPITQAMKDGHIVTLKNDNRPALEEEEARNKIRNLDLTMVRNRIIRPPELGGLNWSQEKAKEMEGQYKAFLFVVWKYSSDAHKPTADIDRFWHAHILFTKEYVQFCNELYGEYLHHDPSPHYKNEKS